MSQAKRSSSLIRMICMVTGRDFLGHQEVTGSHTRLSAISAKTPKGWLGTLHWQDLPGVLQIDPRDLKGHFRAISTFGAHQVLFRADRDATEVTPTAWFDEVRDEALSMRAGLDRVRSPAEVLRLSSHLDTAEFLAVLSNSTHCPPRSAATS